MPRVPLAVALPLYLSVLTGGPALQAQAPDSIGRLLPKGTVEVEILQLAQSPKFHTLAQRLQQAAQRDTAWWSAHLRAAKPGEPLAYHEKMGLTRAEYEEMLTLAERMTLQPAGTARLAIRSEEPGVYTLDGGSDLADLTGVVVDLLRDEVRTPLGPARARTEIHQTDPDSPTGVWDGVQWTLEPANAQTGTVSLAIGRLQADGRGILYYRGGRVQRLLRYRL